MVCSAVSGGLGLPQVVSELVEPLADGLLAHVVFSGQVFLGEAPSQAQGHVLFLRREAVEDLEDAEILAGRVVAGVDAVIQRFVLPAAAQRPGDVADPGGQAVVEIERQRLAGMPFQPAADQFEQGHGGFLDQVFIFGAAPGIAIGHFAGERHILRDGGVELSVGRRKHG